MTKEPINFSVIMPTYNQCSFIRRAILSLMKQTYDKWELIIINDGCTDETEEYIADYLDDSRIIYIKNNENTGLGHALNQGIDAAKNDFIAYLPSDDFFFENHLQSVAQKLIIKENILVYSGIQYDYSDTMHSCDNIKSDTISPHYCMQLVQVAHRKRKGVKWLERNQFLTEDLFLMFWNKLAMLGRFVPTFKVTCFWTHHSKQRHSLLGERYGGGLNKYRSYYQPKIPIKIKVSKNKFINEEQFYSNYRKSCTVVSGSLKILLVGELAYNPERIYALEQAGHRLYGLWDPNPMYSFATVGPLPFGNVTDISSKNWKEEIERIKPDLLYCLLNSTAVPFVYEVVRECQNIPYVWHFKEGPSVTQSTGGWSMLMYLYKHAAGRIYINDIAKQWYEMFLPKNSKPYLILDGDLPKGDYFKDVFSEKLSKNDGQIHTLITGRMIGLDKGDVKYLAENKIHMHLYTENYYDLNNGEDFVYLAPDHFHLHEHVAAENWTEEFSKYDAGWLHGHISKNNGNLIMATWDDLNLPARISTYASAGLPILLPDNAGSIVASNIVVDNLGVGLTFKSIKDAVILLREEVKNRRHSKAMMKNRKQFCFDEHVGELTAFFNNVIQK